MAVTHEDDTLKAWKEEVWMETISGEIMVFRHS